MHFKRSWKNQSLTDQVEPSVLLFCKINLQKTAGQTGNAITNTIDNLYTGQQSFNVSYVSLVSYSFTQKCSCHFVQIASTTYM